LHEKGRLRMRRSMLLVVVALVMAAMVVYSGVAWADPTSCLTTATANPSGGGNAEPGQTGDRARTYAEENHELFGQGTADIAQEEEECTSGGAPGPPGAFDP
jgi:hypothetical protein